MLRLLLATLHLLALGIGLGAVWARARTLGGPLDRSALRRAFAADSWWGIAAALWIITGLWRLLAGTEKVTSYYLHNHAFFAKMGFFVLILVLEIWPMVTLVRWRRVTANAGAGSVEATGVAVDVTAARRIATISYIEAALVICMVAAAVMMARGYGAAG
jgi:putative membrane protein